MSRLIHDLQFPKATTDLTGNKLGRKIYSTQVKPNLDENAENIVQIPESINDVGTSFIQGMYYEISEKYGRDNALKIMKLSTNNKKTLEKINKSIRIYGI